MDLLHRGIEKDIIDEVLGKVDDDCEFSLALEVLASRPVSEWSRAKLYRFLRYRGFTFPIIERVNLYYENLTRD